MIAAECDWMWLFKPCHCLSTANRPGLLDPWLMQEASNLLLPCTPGGDGHSGTHIAPAAVILWQTMGCSLALQPKLTAKVRQLV